MNNEIHSTTGPLRVCLRVRPHLPTDHQQDRSAPQFMHVNSDTEVTLRTYEPMGMNKSEPKEKRFSFDHVFSQKITDQEIFDDFSPYVLHAVEGNNTTLFM